MRLYTAFITLFLFSAPIAHADEVEEFQRKSLRGLKNISVGPVHVPAELEQNGLLTSDEVHTDVELKLRLAGIQVVDLKDFNSSSSSASILNISVNVFSSSDGIWPISVNVGVMQPVLLERDRSILSYGETWGKFRLGRLEKSKIRNVRETIKDMVDQFINSYLAANPK
jgi:hypothetical protein